MKYIFLSVIFFILNYQSVYATENTINREYFSEIHNTLQNNHYSRGECVAFEIDDNVKESDLKKILLCEVPKKIYPKLEKAFIDMLHNSGYEEIQPNKKIDFDELFLKNNS